MSDTTDLGPSDDASEGRRHPWWPPRPVVLGVAALVPIAMLLALLAWGVVRSGSNPGGLVFNFSFGEVAVGGGLSPDFVGETLDGGELRLSDTRGQVVMLDFWNSGCPPCRQEAPDLAQVYEEYRGKGVQFVGLAVWNGRGSAQEYVDRFQISFPNILDSRGQIAIEYGVIGVPEKYFIDRDGELVKKFVGPTNAETLREALDRLLES